MNTKILKYLFLSGLAVWTVALFGNQVISFVFAQADTNPPQLKKINFYQTSYQSGSYFSAYVSANDDFSTVKTINIIIESPSGKDILHGESSYVSGGSSYVSIQIPVTVEVGTWKVKSVYLADSSGNSKSYFYGIDMNHTFSVTAGTASAYGTSGTSYYNSVPCTSFTYSEWSACQNDRTKKRSIVSSSPSLCKGGTILATDLSAPCDVSNTNGGIVTAGTVACTYIYNNDWSACQPNGTKSRTLNSATPAGCIGTPELSQKCSLCTSSSGTNNMMADNCNSDGVSIKGTWDANYCVCNCPAGFMSTYGSSCVPDTLNTLSTCTYEYNEWSACQPNGTKSRTLKSTTPASCTGTPQLSSTCTYTPTVIACTTYGYSEWSACQPNGTKTRTLTYSFPENCTGTPASSELVSTCTYVVPTTTQCIYEYNEWSACQSSGMRTRTLKSTTPTGCAGTPELSETCIYTPPAATCTSFTYNEWSSCQSDNTRVRTVKTSSPIGCTGGAPILKDKCNLCTASTGTNKMMADNCNSDGVSIKGVWDNDYCICTCPTGSVFYGTGCVSSKNTACTSYTYGEWSACQPNGTKTKTAVGYPSGCINAHPIVTETCYYSPATVPVCTAFNYSDWSICQSGGIRTRSSISSFPSNCTGGTPYLSETCAASDTSTSCTYQTYSAWSACQPNGTKIRTVSSSYPSGCTGGTLTLVDNCTYSPLSSVSGTASSVCTSFDYNEWSTCQINGTRVRTVKTPYPSGCTGGNPYLTESCKHVPVTIVNTCTSFTYSDWSACQSDGTRSRSIRTSSPTNCTGGTPSLKEKCSLCTGSTTKDQMNADNCNSAGVSIKGTWDAAYCTCTCPTGSVFGGTSCVSSNISTCTYTYSDWGECRNGLKARTVTSVTPVGCVGGKMEISQTCTNVACQETWKPVLGACIDGIQKKTWIIDKDCPDITSVAPKDEDVSCVSSVECSYTYSAWGECNNGKQSRTVTRKSPEGCNSGTPSLEQTCTFVATPTVCAYSYNDWSECRNGLKTRTVKSKSPENCVPGNPLLEQACRNACTLADWKCEWQGCTAEGKEYSKCSLSPDCIASPTLSQPETERACVYKIINQDQSTELPGAVVDTTPQVAQPEPKEEPLPIQCQTIGWNNKNDCELYLYSTRIVSDCRSNGLLTQDQCRGYFLNKYGKLLKCNGLTDNECNSLINNVILADLKSNITTEVKENLAEVAGLPASIDVQQKTITVQVSSSSGEPSQPKEVKVDSLPISTTTNEQVSVSLIATSNTAGQQALSPVAIAFDSDGDGLPDDVEARYGTNPNAKDTDNDGYNDAEELKMGTDPLSPETKKSNIVLASVEKALVNGTSLEQPKYNEATASTTLAVNSVQTASTGSNKLTFQGKAQPNQVITLFIYSTMPIVVTVKTDANGDWVYDLDKTLVDGSHEVYVAINDDKGKIVEASLPTPFFIQEAQAVSVDEFVKTTGDATEIPNEVNNMMLLYALGGLGIVLILIAGVLIIRERFSE